MVKNPVYGIMVDHVASEFSEVVLTGNKAYQMVRLTGGSGRSSYGVVIDGGSGNDHIDGAGGNEYASWTPVP